MKHRDHMNLRDQAAAMRAEELRRILGRIGVKWSALLETPCPAPAPKPPLDSPVTPNA